MPEETKFADGLMFKRPSPKAPKWIIGNISIKVEEFIKFLQDHDDGSGWVNIDVKESKGGKLYCQLNTYRSDKKTTKKVEKEEAEGPEIEGDGDEIPF